MLHSTKMSSQLETALRILADCLMVILAWGIAMVTRYVIEIGIEETGSPHDVLIEYVEQYTGSVGVLALISLSVFYISGFYTRGRYYQGKYKALIVAQAVTLSYLIFGFVAFLSRVGASLPRSVLFLGWLLTCGLLILARFWSMVWRKIGVSETVEHSRTVLTPRSKSALVIGGAGYIGSALLPKLLGRGYHVRLLDLFLFGQGPIAKVIGHPNLEVVHADFRHMDKVVQAMKGMDEVIHLGAIVGDPACSLDQELTVEVNLIATRMIAEVAKGSGIRRFFFASTCSVYGATDEILDERSAVTPISLYAQSKLASEKVLLELADNSFSPVVLRFGTVYGLSGRTRFDLVVNLLAAKAVVEGRITVYGGGQWRPFLHVDDAALALMKAVEAPSALVHAQIFNAGSDKQNYRLKDAAQIIQSFVPTAEITDMGAGTDFRNYRVDFTKIANVLGFTPRWTLEDGVKQVITALRNGDVRDYQHSMYSNVKFLSEETNSRLIPRENGWAVQLINEGAGREAAATVGVVR